MGTPHVRHQPVVGLHDLCQQGYLAGVVGARLDDGHLVLRTKAQQRQRYADMVVQVALSVQHTVALAQHGRQQLLRRRLAVGARHLYDRPAEAAPVACRQRLQGLQHVGHQHVAAVTLHDHFGIVDDSDGTTLRQRLGGKAVAVERLAPQGKEHTTLRTATAVGRHRRVREV